MEIIHSEQWKEKQFLKNGNHLRDFWDNIKHTNIHILGVQGGKERKKEIKNIFDEIMAENFPNLKETYPGTGSMEGPNEDTPVKTHTKTYHN